MALILFCHRPVSR